jgi:hypothetical protein
MPDVVFLTARVLSRLSDSLKKGMAMPSLAKLTRPKVHRAVPRDGCSELEQFRNPLLGDGTARLGRTTLVST